MHRNGGHVSMIDHGFLIISFFAGNIELFLDLEFIEIRCEINMPKVYVQCCVQYGEKWELYIPQCVRFAMINRNSNDGTNNHHDITISCQ